MSDLKPIRGGKSQVLEAKRKQEENKRKREKRAEIERKKRIQRNKQLAFLAFLAFFIVTGTILIVVNVTDLMNQKKDQSPNQQEQSTTKETTPEIVVDTMDTKLIELDPSWYIYENDKEMLKKLKDRLYSSEKQDERLDFILKNEAAYPPEMIEFLVKYEEVIDFVLKYPIKSRENHTNVVDISDLYKAGKVPTFIQWDDRWGYIPYGDNVIADSGCGPTCLSMAIVALTGRTQYTPIALCKFAEDNGYYVKGAGTAWDLMVGGVRKLGLSSEQISKTEESLRLALKENKLVILSMGPGIFTYSGHFILVYRYDNGLFYVKDPNSIEKSDKGFSYKEIKDQIKGAWSIWNEEE